MKHIDAIGKPCPLPVIMAKKAIKEGEKAVLVAVDNGISAQNLAKMAGVMGLSHQITEISPTRFEVFISGSNEPMPQTATSHNSAANSDLIIAISSDKMGRGDDDLGAMLMLAFLHSVRELDELPQMMLFFNGGAKLTCSGSQALEDLKAIADMGVEIMTCGACLDFYFGTKDPLAVGQVTNMYAIATAMSEAGKLINL